MGLPALKNGRLTGDVVMPQLILYVKGAYGREYTQFNDAMADWEQGLEFVVSSLYANGKFVSLTNADDLMFLGYPIICFTRTGGKVLGFYSLRLKRQMAEGYSSEELDEFCKSTSRSLSAVPVVREQNGRPGNAGSWDVARDGERRRDTRREDSRNGNSRGGSDVGKGVHIRPTGKGELPTD